jgi:hypothetical protein
LERALFVSSRLTKVIAAVAEFIARFWPINRDEESILAQQRELYRRHPPTEDDAASETA